LLEAPISLQTRWIELTLVIPLAAVLIEQRGKEHQSMTDCSVVRTMKHAQTMDTKKGTDRVCHVPRETWSP
jgi:hypothetical protein